MKRVLMRLWAAFWFSVLAVSASAQQPTTSNAPFAPTETGARLVFRNASLIDGSGGPMRPDMGVVTNGQRIEAVLPNAELSPERSEKQTSELQSLMRTTYAVFCLQTKKT